MIFNSKITMGCWQLGGAARPEWQNDAQEAVELCQYAFDRGITSFDVSDAYGNGRAEIILGKALLGRDATVITKVGQLMGVDGAQKLFGTIPQLFEPNYIRMACYQSRIRLFRNQLDVYLLHNPPKNLPDEAWNVMEELKRKGFVRQIGMSGQLPYVDALRTRFNFDVVELPYSIADDSAKAMFGTIPIIGRSPFQGGKIENKKEALEFCLKEKSLLTIVTGFQSKHEIDMNLEIAQAI